MSEFGIFGKSIDARSQPAAVPLPLLHGLSCQRCGTPMLLTRIASYAPGIDERSFQCQTCRIKSICWRDA